MDVRALKERLSGNVGQKSD